MEEKRTVAVALKPNPNINLRTVDAKFPKRLEAARLRLGYSQEMLSDIAGIGGNGSAVSHYERGKLRHPRIGLLAALAGALGVSIDWMLGVTDDPTPSPPRVPKRGQP